MDGPFSHVTAATPTDVERPVILRNRFDVSGLLRNYAWELRLQISLLVDRKQVRRKLPHQQENLEQFKPKENNTGAEWQRLRQFLLQGIRDPNLQDDTSRRHIEVGQDNKPETRRDRDKGGCFVINSSTPRKSTASRTEFCEHLSLSPIRRPSSRLQEQDTRDRLCDRLGQGSKIKKYREPAYAQGHWESCTRGGFRGSNTLQLSGQVIEEHDRMSGNKKMERSEMTLETFHASLDRLTAIVNEMAALVTFQVPYDLSSSSSERHNGSTKQLHGTTSLIGSKGPREDYKGRRPAKISPDANSVAKRGSSGVHRKSSRRCSLEKYTFPALKPEKNAPLQPHQEVVEPKLQVREWPLTGPDSNARQPSAAPYRSTVVQRHSRTWNDAEQAAPCRYSKSKIEPGLLHIDSNLYNCLCHPDNSANTDNSPAVKEHIPLSEDRGQDEEYAAEILYKEPEADMFPNGDLSNEETQNTFPVSQPCPFNFPPVANGLYGIEERWADEFRKYELYQANVDLDNLVQEGNRGLIFDKHPREAVGMQRLWHFGDEDSDGPRDVSAQRQAEQDKTSIGGNMDDELLPMKVPSVRLVSESIKGQRRLRNLKIVCIITPAPADSPMTLPSTFLSASRAGSSSRSFPPPGPSSCPSS